MTGKSRLCGFEIRTVVIALVVWFVPSLSVSQDLTAGDYFEGCQVAATLGAVGDGANLTMAQQLSVASCLGFVDAATAILLHDVGSFDMAGGQEPHVCPTERPDNFEALAVWVSYLQQFPIQLSDDAATTFVRAMSEAFPC